MSRIADIESTTDRIGTLLAPREGMKRLLPLLLLTLSLGGCEIVGGIFKAGFWTAIVLVVLVIAVAGWIARSAGRGRPPPP
jgi:hypothetical protein